MNGSSQFKPIGVIFMKKLTAIFLPIALLFTIMMPMNAMETAANDAADTLHDLGLFSGTGTDEYGNPNYDLDRAPTRHEAVTMLVHLLGKDEEAHAQEWEMPFTDVAEWAKPFVGYAYHNNLTSGVSETEYGGDQLVTSAQYLTFILKALGYESGTDFQWDRAWILSDAIGITHGQYNESTIEFLRGDLAIISASALSAELKNGNGRKLLEVVFPIEEDVPESAADEPQPIEIDISQPDPVPIVPSVPAAPSSSPASGTTRSSGSYQYGEFPEEDPDGDSYVVNMNTHKFHYPTCSSVGRMSRKNRRDFIGYREDLILSGFEPCQICEP